ncbi:MAG: GTPase Era [Alphaproteobacteria bacterium]|nr:MAG: GTPase Era [Alphaproteobacteria bacterium]
MTEENDLSDTRCGFVSVIGLTNVGKSTLVNQMVGSKVSIVSRKVQTTRTRILGMAAYEKTQIVLIDTPGIFKPKKTLEKAMVTAALSSLEDADFIVHLVDVAVRNPLEQNKMIIRSLENEKNVILVLNKVDKISKPALLTLTQDFNAEFSYMSTFMISALSGMGVKDLSKYLAGILPQQPWMYPADQMSDMPMRLMAAEITREKIFNLLHQEIPYAVFVETETWEDFDNGSVKITQLVYVEKESQKSIMLGKNGSKIKAIGQSSREELAEIMGQPVHLKIFVKVQENWAERVENYTMFGLDIPN